MSFGKILKGADKEGREKHVPVIEIDKCESEEPNIVRVIVGKEVPHPNKPGHHIRWITAYFIPKDGKFGIEIGRAEFNAHTEDDMTKPSVSFVLNTNKSGTVLATSYCNIHGLWRNSVDV